MQQKPDFNSTLWSTEHRKLYNKTSTKLSGVTVQQFKS